MAVQTNPAPTARIIQARSQIKSNPSKSESLFREIISDHSSSTPQSSTIANGTGATGRSNDGSTGPDTSALAEYEMALLGLGGLLRDSGRLEELATLVKSSTTNLTKFSKAKTAKLVRQLLDTFPSPSSNPHTIPLQKATVQFCMTWAVSEQRSFLRQSLETRLVALHMAAGTYYDALTLINSLLRELKRLDDKLVLVEVQLLESQVYHALGNQSKARAALTSARTSAASVYTPPALQAGLDMQSGQLHAEDRDFNTAFSYFIEALEGYQALSAGSIGGAFRSKDENATGPDVRGTNANTHEYTAKAELALQYMLLCKVMLNATDDVTTLLTSKTALKLASTPSSTSASTSVSASTTTASSLTSAAASLEAMKAIAQAHAHRSLSEYESALSAHRASLASDVFVKRHLVRLYDTLLEQNLIKVIEPFSRVEISHIAQMVGLDTTQIERKLSQMILDKIIVGVLDQGSGCLIVYEERGKDAAYEAALETMSKLNGVVDALYTNQASLLE